MSLPKPLAAVLLIARARQKEHVVRGRVQRVIDGVLRGLGPSDGGENGNESENVIGTARRSACVDIVPRRYALLVK